MAPRISPLYQQTISYLVSRGNFFPKIQQKQGRRKTAANLANMTMGTIRTLQATVSHSPWTLKIERPRQANTKAQARYPTVSKVTPVTCLEQFEMLRQQQWPVITPHTNKEIIPESPAIQLTRQAKQLTKTIREIYLTGLQVRSTFLKKKDSPSPKAIPISKEHEKRYRKSREIHKLVIPKFESLFIELVTDLKRIIAVASFIMPSPNKTLFRTGQSSCRIRVRAATESVAQRTADRNSASDRVSFPRKRLKSQMKSATMRKVMIVPTKPRKLMTEKFWKKRLFLRLYPAAKMIGGRIRLKNKLFENTMSLSENK